MLLLGVHPVQAAAAPGEAVHAGRDAAASAQVDVEVALAWRDFNEPRRSKLQHDGDQG